MIAASTSFIASVYVVFLLERGLDYKGVALVDGLYMISSAILDYPTGGLADKYGRGRVTALACLFFGIGLAVYSFSRTLYQFLLAEFLAAIGSALYSGAFLAWLVDSLREEGESEKLSIILGNAGILSRFISIMGAFTGGLMAEYSLELPFAAGAISSFTASILALTLTRGRGEVVEAVERSYRELLMRGANILFKCKSLILLTVSSFIVSLCRPSFALTWAPYMRGLGAGKWLLGLTSSIFMATIGLGSYLGGRMTKLFGFKKSAIASILLTSLSYMSMTFANNPYTFILASIPFEIGFGMLTPTLDTWINNYIPSGERATVISLRRTLILPFNALGMTLMGILSDLESPRLAYIFSSITILAAIPVYMKVSEKRDS